MPLPFYIVSTGIQNPKMSTLYTVMGVYFKKSSYPEYTGARKEIMQSPWYISSSASKKNYNHSKCYNTLDQEEKDRKIIAPKYK